jgi:hypothetical protein
MNDSILPVENDMFDSEYAVLFSHSESEVAAKNMMNIYSLFLFFSSEIRTIAY